MFSCVYRLMTTLKIPHKLNKRCVSMSKVRLMVESVALLSLVERIVKNRAIKYDIFNCWKLPVYEPIFSKWTQNRKKKTRFVLFSSLLSMRHASFFVCRQIQPQQHRAKNWKCVAAGEMSHEPIFFFDFSQIPPPLLKFNHDLKHQRTQYYVTVSSATRSITYSSIITLRHLVVAKNENLS